MEVRMQTEAHPLESFFYHAVRASFVDKLALNDPEIIEYVTQLLCEFSDPNNLHRLKDATGHRVETVAEMPRAADPVYGTASSFEEERRVGKYVGDYALFTAGMHLDVMESAPHYQIDRAAADELIKIGRESYFMVSQFDVFEYEKEAPLFARMADNLDRLRTGAGADSRRSWRAGTAGPINVGGRRAHSRFPLPRKLYLDCEISLHSLLLTARRFCWRVGKCNI